MLSLKVQNRQRIEREICTKLIEPAIGAGYTISVFNGEDTVIKRSVVLADILAVMFSVDEETLKLHKDGGTSSVFLTYGECGYDVIADHNSTLEELLEPVFKFAETFQV